ncbi:MAG: CAP domain-containing protein [Deltaproteobacteria bacterium]|nr:CAP domain-containing protein [Deltaproteobacteria bacterium]
MNMRSIFVILAAAIFGLSGCFDQYLADDYTGQSRGRYQQHGDAEYRESGQRHSRRQRRGDSESRGGRDSGRQYEQQDKSAQTQARQVLDIVNQERQRNGAPRLSWDNTLAQIAQIRAKELSSRFSHTRPNGANWASLLNDYKVSWSLNGENIASGQGQDSAQKVMTIWMNSSGHRANILDSRFTHLGVGAYNDGRQHYWVQVFIRR